MKTQLKYIIAILFFHILTVNILQAETEPNTGAITGKIIDKTTNEGVIGATVMIKGMNVGAVTDIEGKFIIPDVNPGSYSLVISCISFKTSVVDNVQIEKNKMVFLEVSLDIYTSDLQEVKVVANKVTSTEVSMLATIKANSVVANGITSQQILKTADRDASEVVRRLPGITIMNDRFVVVRGLSQRYNNVWLNNLPVPSSEADIKSFSFDVIPSSMIDNIMIYKTVSPDIPAEFAGGFIRIYTKNLPEKNSFSVSYSSSYSEGTTFSNINAYKGGKYDWLGFDDGTRALPSGMPSHLNNYDLSADNSTREKMNTISKSMNQNWTLSAKTVLPDQRLSFSLARLFSIGNVKVGQISSLSYSYTMSEFPLEVNNYSIYNYSADRPSYIDELSDNQNTQSAKIGLLHNWIFSKGNTKIEFRNLLNNIGYSRTTIRDGVDWHNDGREFKSYDLKFLSRTTYSGQLGGEHAFNNRNTILDWNVGYSYANKKEPDTKRYRLNRDRTDTTRYFLSFGDVSNPDLSSESRIFQDLNENIVSANTGLTRKFNFIHRDAEFKTGLYAEYKSREFNARNFGYSRSSINSKFTETYISLDEIFIPENFNLTDGIKMMEVTGKSDSYTAKNTNLAGYALFRFYPISSMNISTGIRVEINEQTLDSYKQGQNIKVKVDRSKVDIFPSLNATYNINSKTLLRCAYGITLNRPEFREIAPFYFVDFDLNAGVYGNPDLQQSTIHNFDLRIERYPSNGETVSLAFFYKYFDNPIEQVILGNNPIQYSFENVKNSTSYGLELEIRKSLDIISLLKNFNLVFNGSLIKSEVYFDEGKLQRQRPMQGQSPYIINAGLYYQDNNYTASILYNIIGKRIIAVGRPSPNQWEDIPNIYEMPRHSMDFNIARKIGEYVNIQLGIKNIINQPVKYAQEINADVDMALYTQNQESGVKHFERTQTTRLFKPGRYVTFGVSLKF